MSSSLILTTSLPINDKISSTTYTLARSSSHTSSSFSKPTRPLPESSTRNYRKSTSDIKIEPTVGSKGYHDTCTYVLSFF